jgi:hypothetical protein
MKKGCFISGIVVFTVLVIIGMYFYRSHKGMFSEFGRNQIINNSLSEISAKIDTTIRSSYKDSLKILVNQYKMKKKNPKFNDAMEDFSEFVRKIQMAIKDKQVDSLEFAELKQFVKDYERPKKD